MTTPTRWTPEEFAVLMADATAAEDRLAASNQALYGPVPASFSEWCKCGPLDPDLEVFFKRADGSHGMWHPSCRGLVQSG